MRHRMIKNRKQFNFDFNEMNKFQNYFCLKSLQKTIRAHLIEATYMNFKRRLVLKLHIGRKNANISVVDFRFSQQKKKE